LRFAIAEQGLKLAAAWTSSDIAEHEMTGRTTRILSGWLKHGGFGRTARRVNIGWCLSWVAGSASTTAELATMQQPIIPVPAAALL